ncbi:hypothetical protein [Thioflexithrix psekupsensis]|uniref:hypothetical protein n=1 Tax=Thioflexithrix psekupsensis TaxID=1570016 RepID=UPI000A38CA4A|nr:hypothetical protein [Thioflexithrix psekupsensis]
MHKPIYWFYRVIVFENYLINPDALLSALPPTKREKVIGKEEQFKECLIKDIDRWRKHGALWSVINPLWEKLRRLGFNKDLLTPEIATDDTKIKAMLQTWYNLLNAENIFNDFQEKLEHIKTKPLEEQLALHIHGKRFYQQVVDPCLNTLIGQQESKERFFNLFKELSRNRDSIRDLDFIWERMGLNPENA